MKLKDKIAIVTGGSSGIGEAICYAYAKEGATVIVVNKKHPENGKKVANKIIQENGKAEAIACDIADENAVKNLVEQVIRKYGRVDILVNNAGIIVVKPFEEQTSADWEAVLNTNLKSAFLLSRAVIPFMKKQQYGKIIFMASTAASTGYANIAPYSASKGGLIAMMKSMVVEFAKYNININCISPASTVTPANTALLENKPFMEQIAKRMASGKPMLPEDMAGAAVFLASDDARAVHGIELIVDNGWRTF